MDESIMAYATTPPQRCDRSPTPIDTDRYRPHPATFAPAADRAGVLLDRSSRF